MVGLCLGQIGHWLGGNLIGTKLYWIAALSLALAVREWGWINFYIPERERQSEKAWAHQFGFVMASAMWGFHIGLGFATLNPVIGADLAVSNIHKIPPSSRLSGFGSGGYVREAS